MSPAAQRHDPRLGIGSRLFFWLLPSVLLPLALRSEQRAWCTLAYDALLGLAFVLDALRVQRAELTLTRGTPARPRLGEPLAYALRLENRSGLTLRATLADDSSEGEVQLTPTPRALLAPSDALALTASYVPARRGPLVLGPLYVQLESRLGLARVARSVGAAEPLAVAPAPSRAAAIAPDTAHSLGLLARGRSAGQARDELEGLRDYQYGDAPRTLDQRATVKHGRPIVRVFREERDDPLWLVLDVGRSMLRRSDDPAHAAFLERAITAALALVAQAIASGRRVGLVAFDAVPRARVEPGCGTRQRHALVEALATLGASQEALDPDALYRTLRAAVAGRAELVLITALNARRDVAPLVRACRALAARHSLRCVLVSEARPRAADLAPLDDPAALFARAARSDLAAAEGAHLREVERAGIPVLYFEARTARATQREDARSPTP